MSSPVVTTTGDEAPVSAAEPAPDTPPAATRTHIPDRPRRRPVLRFVLRRLGGTLVTLVVVSMVIFGAVQALPGDPAQAVLGRDATPERIAAVEAALGLDRALIPRYLDWLGGVLTGDLGVSTAAAVQGQELRVWDDISAQLINSLTLAALTTVVFCLVCLPLGTIAALRRGQAADHGISAVSLALGAMPEFTVATLLIAVFFTWLGWFPPLATVASGAGPLDDPVKLVLPILTLLCVAGSYGIRLIRATTLETLSQDHVVQARLNGIPERDVVRAYVLRNAIAPNVQALANTVRYLVGGIIITEAVFAYPGIGAKLISAVSLRDVQEVTVISLLLASVYIVVNLLADLAVVLLVPKLRTEQFG